MIGAIALPPYNTGDKFSDIQKKCSDYAAARALEDLQRNGHVSTPTTIQAYVDECAANIDGERQTRQAMILLAMVAGAGAVWWLCRKS